jgi:hypothetical protein
MQNGIINSAMSIHKDNILAMLTTEKYKYKEIIWEPATDHSVCPALTIIASTYTFPRPYS